MTNPTFQPTKTPHLVLAALLLASLAPACGNSLLAAGSADQAGPGPQAKGYRIVERDRQWAVVDDRDALVGEFVPCKSDVYEAEDVVEATGANLIHWRRTFSLKPGQAKQRVRLTMDFRAAHLSRFALIPGVSWDGNRNDPGNVYRGFSCDGVPWSFASHRTLIPGATYSEGDRHTVGLWADVGDPRIGLSCSLIPSEGSTVHRLIVPEEELPKRVLIRERGLSAGRANALELAPGQRYAVSAWLVLHPLERPKTGYRYLLDAAWEHNFKKTAACHPAEELWRLGIRFSKESLWDERAKMFSGALKFDDKRRCWSCWTGWGQFAIGWAGRNGELANVLLADFLKSGDKGSLKMALDCLDTWAKRAVPEKVAAGAGAGGAAASDPLSRFRGLATDANTLADGATAFLQAYQTTRRCGVDRPEYREIGLGICDAALAVQKPDGRFEGPYCKRGAIGAALIAPLLIASEMNGKPKYREGAKSALRFYMGMLYRDGCLWGGALDTRSIDQETIQPLLAGAVRLYELTGESEFLTHAENAAYYLAAWQIAQTVPNPPGSLADAIHYESFGGMSTATVHMLTGPFLYNFPHLLKLAKYTGREIWTQRAVALWNHASQGISDGTLALQGLPPRPCGSQDESVNFTDWGYDFCAQGMDRNNPRGAGQCWLTSWPSSLRLTILSDPELRRRIETWPVK